MPPTPRVLWVAKMIEDAVKQFLLARRTVPPLDRFEADVEAMKLFNMVVRNIEAITELAKVDLVLLPSANVLARVVFEIAIKATWMITPNDPFEREVRWLAHLQEEERIQERLARKVVPFGGDPTHFNKHRDQLRNFRTGVVSALPPGYAELPGDPSVEQMLESIGQTRDWRSKWR